MSRKRDALLTLTLIALALGIINSAFDIMYKAQRTFESSVVNDYGESLKVRLVADSGAPPFLWYLAWRVNGQEVTDVTMSVSITPSATNVGNLKVTYYLKAVSEGHEKKFLEATDYSVSSGNTLSNSTTIGIDQQFTQMGLSVEEDHTVDYYIYCKVTGTGLISGETLTAEIPLTKFDTLEYDYGSSSTVTITTNKDAYVDQYFASSNYGSQSKVIIRAHDSENCRGYFGFDLSSIPSSACISSAILKLRVYTTYSDVSTQDQMYVYQVTGSWSESSITWNNQPSLSSEGSGDGYLIINDIPTFPSTGSWISMDITSLVQDDFPNEQTDYMVRWVDEGQSSNYEVWFYSKEYSSSSCARLEITYVDWSGSWSWFNLPLSVVSLPIGQQFLAAVFMVLAFAVWAAAREKARRRRRRK